MASAIERNNIWKYDSDVMMSVMAFRVNSVSIVYSIFCDRWIPSQRASDAENVSIWWGHHEFLSTIADAVRASDAKLINFQKLGRI